MIVGEVETGKTALLPLASVGLREGASEMLGESSRSIDVALRFPIAPVDRKRCESHRAWRKYNLTIPP